MYFAVPKNTRLFSTHYFIKTVSNKGGLQRIGNIYSPDMNFEDFMNVYKKWTAKPYYFLVNDTTLAPDNSWITNHDTWCKVGDANYKTISITKQQNNQHYQKEKLISMSILSMKEYYLLNKVEW